MTWPLWLGLLTAGHSVFAVAVFHATLNLTYMLFPFYGSYFDMRLSSLVMAFAAAMVTDVGGQTLARFNVPDDRCVDA